jgi:hypothetical protein
MTNNSDIERRVLLHTMVAASCTALSSALRATSCEQPHCDLRGSSGLWPQRRARYQ